MFKLRTLRHTAGAALLACAAVATAAAPATAGSRGINLGHTKLYAMAGVGLARLHADGTFTPLTKIPHKGQNALVSPDGRWVSYRRDVGVYVMRTDGTGNRRVAGAGAIALDWAPDSRSLLLKPPGRMLTILHVASAVSRPLAQVQDGNVYSAAFSPDSRYVLVSDETGWRLLRTSNGVQRPFLKAPCDVSVHLTWSPDGHRIALMCPRPSYDAALLTVVTIATGKRMIVGDTRTGIPVWVGNASLLAQQVNVPGGGDELRTYDLKGRVTGRQALSQPVDIVTSAF